MNIVVRTHRKTCSSLIAIALLTTLSSGCGKPSARQEPLRPSQVHDFAALYAQNCSGCHGANGKLGPAPPLNDSMFLTIAPPNELRQVISAGRHGTMMPAFAREHGGTLTPLQVDVLIDGMLRWNTEALDVSKLPTYLALLEPEPGAVDPTTTAQATPDHAAGEQLFAKHCASCHGDQGTGGMGGALRVPAFLALVSDQALRRIIITGRPDLGMPDYRARAKADGKVEPLTSAQINQIVALLASWRDLAHTPPPAEQAMR